MTELPSVDNFICSLQKCRKIKDLAHAKRVHAHVCNNGVESHRAVGNYIVPMFVECGSVSDAQHAFNRLVHRNEHSWTSLILGYIECKQTQHALNLYKEMQKDCVRPSSYTLMTLLKACAKLQDIKEGRELHAEIVQKGFGSDIFVGSSLVDMYAKCGSLSEAQRVFDELPVCNVVSWNALIAGYAEHGPGQKALTCLDQMQLDCVSPDAVTFVCILKASGSMGAISKGLEMHTEISRKGLGRNFFVGNTLIDMYAKCGSMSHAREVFDKMPVRDVVSWAALIAGYTKHGPGWEALKCFEQMQLDGVSLDAIMFACALKACGSIGAIGKGREIHMKISEKGFGSNQLVGSTLVDMYAKCGSISDAREAFNKLPVQDVVSWSAMIRAYGVNHQGNMVLKCFKDMQKQGVKPDAITFTCLLTACSHNNLICDGQEFLKVMKEDYGIAPTIDHYTCMVDLLARWGHLFEAEKIIDDMLCPPSGETWTALLSACKTYGEAELGLKCFQHLVQMNPEFSTPYVLMANIYASAGRWDDACGVEELRKYAGAKKKPASAFIEVNKKMHEFMLDSNKSKEISGMLELVTSRIKGLGHVPYLALVVRPSYEDEESASWEHVVQGQTLCAV